MVVVGIWVVFSIDMGANSAEPVTVTIRADKSSIPVGVGGDAEDAGDVDVECEASGVSGVPGESGGVRYAGVFGGMA